jgi:hypothetical protein
VHVLVGGVAAEDGNRPLLDVRELGEVFAREFAADDEPRLTSRVIEGLYNGRFQIDGLIVCENAWCRYKAYQYEGQAKRPSDALFHPDDSLWPFLSTCQLYQELYF